MAGASLFAGAHAVKLLLARRCAALKKRGGSRRAGTGIKTATYCYDQNGNMVAGDGRTRDARSGV